jgi:spore maturation protein CgeB
LILNRKILAFLPESIGGRLTMTSLFNGFKRLGFDLKILDKLQSGVFEQVKLLDMSEYDFMISYDFVAVEFKTELGLDIKTVNYFSDVIESKTSGSYWQKYYEKLSDSSNFVFYWDKKLCQRSGENIANLYYLPHAVDVDIYKNTNAEPEYDVMFAGRLTYNDRVERFLKIVKALPDVKFALFCFEKHLKEACLGLSEAESSLLHGMYKGFIDTEEKMADAINKSKIVLNFTSQGESSLNYRLFQVLACEKFLLTDYRDELGELFTIGEDVTYYENDAQLIEKITDYLANPGGYNFMLKNARKKVESKYTTEHAAQFILDKIY